MHLPLEHRGKTVCQSPVSASPIAGGTCLPRLPMHLSSRTFYSGHDLLPSPTTGEVQGAAEAPLYRLHIFDHFVPPRLEGQSVQHSGSCPRQSPYNVHAAHGYPPLQDQHLHFVQQRLPLPHWSYQPQTMLLQSQHHDLVGCSFHGGHRPEEAYCR